MKKIFSLSLAFLFATVGAAFSAPIADDSVLSQHVKEADGITSQNTNAGSGIKTGHIQDDAVTTPKIADGAVTDQKISGIISGSKLGTHTHNGSDIVDATISTSKISDGAITDEKIAGPISASKISDGVFQKKYANVIVVAKSGGDFTDPVTAVGSITDASATNPYLIKIMPGVYDIGSGTLGIASYVDVEGSGRNATIITGSGHATAAGTIAAGGASEIRNLTIENTGGDVWAVAVKCTSDGKVKLRDISLNASGGTQAYGIFNNCSDLTIENSDISVLEAGVAVGVHSYNYYNNFKLKLKNVSINASGGVAYGLNGQCGANIDANNVSINFSESSQSAGIQIFAVFSIKLSNVSVNGDNTASGIALKVHPDQCGNTSITPNVNVYDSILKATYSLENSGGTVNLSTTQLDGIMVGATKIINCFDGSFNPITNQ